MYTCCHRGQGGDGNSFPVIYRERGSTDKENSRNNAWPYFLFRIDDSVLAVTVYLPPLDGGRVDLVLRLYGGRLWRRWGLLLAAAGVFFQK